MDLNYLAPFLENINIQQMFILKNRSSQQKEETWASNCSSEFKDIKKSSKMNKCDKPQIWPR